MMPETGSVSIRCSSPPAYRSEPREPSRDNDLGNLRRAQHLCFLLGQGEDLRPREDARIDAAGYPEQVPCGPAGRASVRPARAASGSERGERLPREVGAEEAADVQPLDPVEPPLDVLLVGPGGRRPRARS